MPVFLHFESWILTTCFSDNRQPCGKLSLFPVLQFQFLSNHCGENIKVKSCYCENIDHNILLEIVKFHLSDLEPVFR